MPRRPEVLNAPVRNDEKFISMNTRPERGMSMSLRYFEDRESREKWIGKVEIVRIDPHTNLLDEKEIEGRAWHEKLASDIYDFYGVEVPRLELSKQQCLFNIRTYGFRSLPTVTHLMSKVVPNFSPYNHLPVLNPAEENLYLEVNRMRVKERGLGSVLAVALWINDIDVLGGSFNNIGYIIEERSEGRVAKTINIDFGYAFAGLAEGVTKEHIQTLEEQTRRLNIRKVQGDSGANIYLNVDCFSKNTKIEFSRTLWDILNTSDEEIEAFFQRREMPDWIHQRYQVLVPVLKYRRDTLREAYAEDIGPYERVEREPPARRSLIERIEADIERRHSEADTQQLLASYISPDASSQPGSEVRFSFKEKFEEFINHSQKKTMVIYGDSGAGKTLGSLEIEKKLFEIYKSDQSSHPPKPLPIRIELNRFDQVTVHRCVYNTLKDAFHGSDEEIEALRQSQSIIFILDGYDEISGGCEGNLYETNQLEHWQAKIITTCRWQTGTKTRGICESPQFREHETCYLMPFTLEQMERYGRSWFDANQSLARGATWTEAQRLIEQMPDLANLIGNPFLLKVFLGALPELLRQEQESRQTQDLTSWRLYAAFMKQWFEKDDLRQANQLLRAEQSLSQQFQAFSESLAWEMYANNIVEVTDRHAELWERFFTNPEFERARIGCPLRRSGEHAYRFIHKSFLEYFVALNLWKLLIQETLQSKAALLEKLNARFLVEEPEVIRFLVEALENIEFEIRQRYQSILLDIVLSSRDYLENAKAASSAITLLNTVGMSLSGLDLSGVQIPRANLGRGLLAYTNFAGADLSEVVFTEAWLSGADLKRACLKGVAFGEGPYLENGSEVTTIAFSLDGRILASGSKDKTVRLWEVGTGRPLGLWKVGTGRAGRRVGVYSKGVESIAFNPDGRILASGGSDDETVRLWEVETGRPLDDRAELRGHTRSVHSVAFSPNGLILASGSDDNTVRLWEVGTGRPLAGREVLRGHSKGVSSVAFSPDGRILASGSDDKTVRLWEVETGRPLAGREVLRGHSKEVSSVAFSPDGRILAGGYDSMVKLWEVEIGRPLAHREELRGHTRSVHSVAFSPDGRILAVGGDSCTVNLLEVKTGGRPFASRAQLRGHSGKVSSVAFSPDGRILASGSEDKTVRLWEVGIGRLLDGRAQLAGHNYTVCSVAFSPDGRILASGSRDKTVRLWEVGTGRAGRRVGVYSKGVESIAFNPDGRILASGGSDDETVRLWEVESGRPLAGRAVLGGYTGWVNSLAFSPDGRILASGSDDKTVRLWEVETGRPLAGREVLRGHSKGVSGVAFSPDGRILASGSDDKMVRLWEVETGRPLAGREVLRGHSSSVRSVAFSPDGQILASGSNDHTVRLWEVETGRPLAGREVLAGHSGFVDSVAFSPDGRILASGSKDQTARLWEVANGREIAQIKMYGTVYSLSFSRIDFLHQNEWIWMLGVCNLKGILQWRISRDGRSYQLHTRNEGTVALHLDGVQIEENTGLSERNVSLLNQRGAQGSPEVEGERPNLNGGVIGTPRITYPISDEISHTDVTLQVAARNSSALIFSRARPALRDTYSVRSSDSQRRSPSVQVATSPSVSTSSNDSSNRNSLRQTSNIEQASRAAPSSIQSATNTYTYPSLSQRSQASSSESRISEAPVYRSVSQGSQANSQGSRNQIVTTESNVSQSDLIYLVKGVDDGRRNIWCYVLVERRKLNSFQRALCDPPIHLKEYGRILHMAYGDEPPRDLTERLKREYGITGGIRSATLPSRQRAQASSGPLPQQSEHRASVSAAGMYSSSHRPAPRQQSSSDCCCVVL